jgi:hypothetical protein
MRDSFIIYRSYFEAIENLNDADKGVLFSAICRYGLDGVEPEFDGYFKMFWVMLKPTLDKSMKRYETSVENGSKGGRPKKTKTQQKPKNNLNETQTKPNQNLNDNDNDNVNDNEKEKNISVSESAHALIKFIKDKCPQVAKMKYPLTLEESERLVNEYSKTDIAKLFNEMDNWGDLKKKTSANKTFRSWAQRGSVQKIIEKAEYKFQPKAISSELPQQSIQFLHDKFGLPLDWNEYEIPSRSYFIKAHQNQEIKRYFL